MTCATLAPLPVMPASIFASATAQSIGASIPRTGAGSLGGMGTRATSTLRHGRRASETIHIEKRARDDGRSEEHTSELQSLMRISYAVFCLKKKTKITHYHKPQNATEN